MDRCRPLQATSPTHHVRAKSRPPDLACPVVYLEGDELVGRLRASLSTDQAVEWIPSSDITQTVRTLPAGVICMSGPLWSDNCESVLRIVCGSSPWALAVLCTEAGEESERGVPVSTAIDAVDIRNPGQAFRSILRLGQVVREQERRRQLEQALEKQTRNLWMMHEIGKALGSERDLGRLLDLILTHARRITGADSGSIYILRIRTPNGIVNPPCEDGEPFLHFAHTQSDTLDLPHHGSTIEINCDSMAGYVALTGEILNIPDAYRLPPDVPYKHNTSFDRSAGYRTVSILTLPMRNAEDQIIGVLQLINKKSDPSVVLRPPERAVSEVVPFTGEDEELSRALAGQAGVALENSLLYESIERLFEGFVRASVQAIEARDPTTSGHSERVALLTVALAEAASQVSSGPLRDISFTPEQLREIRYAALLHDFGKVGVREHILVKARKLYPREWENVVLRFALVKRTIRFANYRQRVEILRTEGPEAYLRHAKDLDKSLHRELNQLDEMLATLELANSPQILSGEIVKTLEEIANRTYEDIDGCNRPLLTPHEVVNLSIPKGTLNEEERREIESHVTHTYQFLRTIPWTRSLRGVPAIAHAHHERLDGSGYPLGLVAPEIMPQSRMMSIADIYDALTAADRPYKRALPPEKALEVLRIEAEHGRLDMDLVRLFIDRRIYEKTTPARRSLE